MKLLGRIALRALKFSFNRSTKRRKKNAAKAVESLFTKKITVPTRKELRAARTELNKHERTLEKIRVKSTRHEAKGVAKIQRRNQKQQVKLAKQATAAVVAGRLLNPAKITRYLGVARLLSPILIPALYKAIGSFQSRANQRTAGSLGVKVAELGSFSGTGASLASRVESARKSLARLQQTNSGNLLLKSFITESTRKLEDLANAVNTAERLPNSRRVQAQEAIDTELKVIEKDLFKQLGITAS